MAIRVVVAGATGWTGGAVAKAILGGGDFFLAGAVARGVAGKDAGDEQVCRHAATNGVRGRRRS